MSGREERQVAENAGPLKGLRVLELAGIGPGPFAAMLLADLGAEVVRVDRPGGSEVASGVLDRSRRAVIIDLRKPEGAAAVLDLAAHADVLIEGYRPGVAERLGVGPDACWERNPKLVYGRMTGWGQEGPWAHTAGHDIGYISITGALHAMGRAGGPPAVPLNLVGDFAGGSMYLVMGVLAAIYEAQRSGKGQVVDAAIVDGTASLMAMPYAFMANGNWRDERGTNMLDTGTPYYDVYETADGLWMGVGALEAKFYAEFVQLLGLSEAEADRSPDKFDQLREHIAAKFKTKTRDEWTQIFEGTDACVAPILSMREAPRNPQLAARQTYIEIDGQPHPAPAPRFSRTPSATPTAAGNPGSDTRAALTDWGVANVDALIESGIAVQS